MSEKKLRLRCEICGEPVGFWSEHEHLHQAHPEIMAARRKTRRIYLILYFPLAMIGFVFAFASLAIHDWWWRLGFLGGIYASFALIMVFGIRQWRRERPLHLTVEVACSVCDRKTMKKDFRAHIQEAHPIIHRQMKRTGWLLTTFPYGFLVYVLALLGAMIMDVFPDWSVVPWLMFGPTLGWMAVIAAVGIYMDRRYLRPAKAEWKLMHPPFR